jgi:abhydrolase domain-containing protein 6
MKKKLAFGSISVVLLMVVIYFFFPQTLFNLAVRVQRSSSGLVKKVVQVDDHQIAYLEGGKGETVVLLHGFGGNKDLWTPFAKHLTTEYHVVIPDIPGFGESAQVSTDSYDLESQVKRLDRFSEVLKYDRYHLAGNSMGGAITAIYGAKHPQKILTITLLDTVGARSPKTREVLMQLFKEDNPLLISSSADFDKLMQLCFVKPPPIPTPFKKLMVADAIAHKDFNKKIWDDMKWNDIAVVESLLEPYLHLIKAPVLIIWGNKDKIVDVSGVSFLEKNLKGSKTVILKDTGHVPMMEKPQETAASYVSFLKNKI